MVLNKKVPISQQQNSNLDLQMINNLMKYEMNQDFDQDSKSLQEESKNNDPDEKLGLVKHFSENAKDLSYAKNLDGQEKGMIHKGLQQRREKFKKMDKKQRQNDSNLNKGNVFSI